MRRVPGVRSGGRAEEPYRWVRSEEFAQLQQHTDADKLSAMAKAVKAAEAMAPTRPLAGVESAAANIAVRPFAAIVDRTRDAVRKALGQNG